MENPKAEKNQEEKTFPAIVVKVIDDHKVVINKGARDNIKEGQRFLLYKLEEEEIKDPTTGKSLGYLEVVKGTGKVTHVQERMSTIESDKRGEPSKKTIIKRISPILFFPAQQHEETAVSSGDFVPFEQPDIGDKAKPIG